MAYVLPASLNPSLPWQPTCLNFYFKRWWVHKLFATVITSGLGLLRDKTKKACVTELLLHRKQLFKI